MLNIIDIGAAGGVFKEWKEIKDLCNIIGFEPNKEECDRINQSIKKDQFLTETYYPYAIGKESGKNVPFYLTKSRTCSSLIAPNNEEFEKYGIPGSLRQTRGHIDKIIDMKVSSLKDFISKENIKPDFIKIDTQGSELQILEGLGDKIESCLGFELEVEFVELYKKQPLFSEVELFMRNNGFELFGLKRNILKMNNGKDYCTENYGGRLIHGDALFFNKKIFDVNTQELAIRYALLAKRYELFDLMDFIISKSQITDENIEQFKLYGTGISSIKKLYIKYFKKHRDKGLFVEFDKKYGF
jgi:FkbM family methyltransferase